ncbi:MAG: hypothetical protein ACI4J1_00865 [Ruminiclostridium sp.]
MADKRSSNGSSEGNGFKSAPLGYDKQDVNAYIANLNKSRQQMEADYKLQVADLEKKVEEAIANSISEEKINELNKEHEEKIMELRKLVLDERRHVAQLEKESVKAQMAEQKAEKEMDKLRAIAEKQSKEIAALKKNGAAASGDNGGVAVEDAYKQAEKIIESAKAYAKQVVLKTNKYKSDVEAKLAEMKAKLEAATSEIGAIFKQTIAEADSARALADEIPEFDFEELDSMKPVNIPEAVSSSSSAEEAPAVSSEDDELVSFTIPSEDNIATVEIQSEEPAAEAAPEPVSEPEPTPEPEPIPEPEPVSEPAVEIADEPDDLFSELGGDEPEDNDSDMSTDDIFDNVFGDNEDNSDEDLSTANGLNPINRPKPKYVHDFKLDSADTPVEKGENLAEVDPVPDEKGDDLNAELFEMLVDPASNKQDKEFEALLTKPKDEDELDDSAESAVTFTTYDAEEPSDISNISFTIDEPEKKEEKNDFDEFADLFVGGDDNQFEEAPEEDSSNEENVWDFSTDSSDEDDDDMSSDNNDFSDLLI